MSFDVGAAIGAIEVLAGVEGLLLRVGSPREGGAAEGEAKLRPLRTREAASLAFVAATASNLAVLLEP